MIKKSTALLLLRLSLGLVFIWFGALKIFGVSPVVGMIQTAYPSFPEPVFIIFLGVWEMLIGLGFIFNRMIKATVALMWLQMAGIFYCLIIAPQLFFQNGNPFLLTADGEFVIKNIVLLAASVVVLTHRDEA